MWILAKSQDKFRNISWSKNDSNYLEFKFEILEQDDNKDFRLVQNLPMRQADFNQFMRLRNQLVIAAENFGTEETLSPLQISTMSKETDDHLKLVYKVVDRANNKICVPLLRYNVDNPK